VWVGFVSFIYEFGSASSPFLWGAVVFGHDSKKLEDKVMCRFGEVFEDLIRYGVWSGALTGRCLVARGGVVDSCEVVV